MKKGLLTPIQGIGITRLIQVGKRYVVADLNDFRQSKIQRQSMPSSGHRT